MWWGHPRVWEVESGGSGVGSHPAKYQDHDKPVLHETVSTNKQNIGPGCGSVVEYLPVVKEPVIQFQPLPNK